MLVVIAFKAINRVCIDSPSCHEMQLAGTSAVGVVMAVAGVVIAVAPAVAIVPVKRANDTLSGRQASA